MASILHRPAEHGIRIATAFGRVRVFGWSQWDQPVGNGRLMKPVGRDTELRNAVEVRRWAKRFDNVPARDVEAALDFFSVPSGEVGPFARATITA